MAEAKGFGVGIGGRRTLHGALSSLRFIDLIASCGYNISVRLVVAYLPEGAWVAWSTHLTLLALVDLVNELDLVIQG